MVLGGKSYLAKWFTKVNIIYYSYEVYKESHLETKMVENNFSEFFLANLAGKKVNKYYIMRQFEKKISLKYHEIQISQLKLLKGAKNLKI